MKPSPDRLRIITRKLADYFILHTLCIQKAQTLECDRGVMFQKLEEAQRDWQSDPSNPLAMPPRDDEKKRAAFFSKCDEICSLKEKARTVQEWGKISFACSAAVFVLEEQDLAEDERDEVMKNSSALAHHEFVERHSQQNSYTDPSGVKIGHMTTNDLSNLLSSNGDATTNGSLGPRVVHQTYRVRNPVNKRVATCTVVDFGVSHLRGEWYEVEFDDSSTAQITRKEMEEILIYNEY